LAAQAIAEARASAVSVPAILRRLLSDPAGELLFRWNWKAAVMSSLLRAHIFLAANATAGLRKALFAAAAEFAFRFLTSGFYGSLTQAFRNAEPAWAGVLAVMILLPLISHSMEFAVHFLRGTPHLKASIIASVIFTMFSTAFNWFAMRRGALVVGDGQTSLRSDLARVPELLVDFFKAGAQISSMLYRNIYRNICFEPSFACNRIVKRNPHHETDARNSSL
jgi:hypothetical protein